MIARRRRQGLRLAGEFRQGDGRAGQAGAARHECRHVSQDLYAGRPARRGRHARSRRCNLADGDGNFFLKPNGVFHGRTATARRRSWKRAPMPRQSLMSAFATQSGPMLVIDGALHPRFEPNGKSRNIRNGVGVRDRDTRSCWRSRAGGQPRQLRPTVPGWAGLQQALFFDGAVSALSNGEGDDRRRRISGRADHRGVGEVLRPIAINRRGAVSSSASAPCACGSTCRFAGLISFSRRRSRSDAVERALAPPGAPSRAGSLPQDFPKRALDHALDQITDHRHDAYSGALVCSASACSTPPMLPFSAS